jgi:hypothetical protein
LDGEVGEGEDYIIMGQSCSFRNTFLSSCKIIPSLSHCCSNDSTALSSKIASGMALPGFNNGDVDSEKQKSLSKRLQIKRFPTILVYQHGPNATYLFLDSSLPPTQSAIAFTHPKQRLSSSPSQTP